MIKARLVPNFFLTSNDFNNGVFEKHDVEKALYIECELPCVPFTDSSIGIADFKEEIFSQYSRFLMKINNNIHRAIRSIRSRVNDESCDCYYLREEYPNLSNASNIDILRVVINQTIINNVYLGDGLVRVKHVLCFPNDEYVYIMVSWQ